MKANELRDMRDDVLQKTLSDLCSQLFKLRCQKVTENLENNRAIKNVKRDIARCRTIMTERQSASKGE